MSKVEILAPLKQYVDNQKVLEVNGGTVGNVVESLLKNYPRLKDQLFDSLNHPRDFINYFLNGEDIRNLEGFETKLKEEDKLVIMPAIAGG